MMYDVRVCLYTIENKDYPISVSAICCIKYTCKALYIGSIVISSYITGGVECG